MIQLNDKIGADIPAVLTTIGIAERDSNNEEYDNGIRDFTFKSSIYGHEDVKGELKRIQKDKCCFCESRITHISYGDVEHYRPKAGWVQEDEPLNRPGYYWLAYDWENLFLACQLCNQKWKKNYFPLEDNSPRASFHNDSIENEIALFIHPVLDNPEDFIAFEGFDVKGKNKKGNVTIKNLRLNRPELVLQRNEKYILLEGLYKVALLNAPNRIEAIQTITDIHARVVDETFEYSAMFKAFFAKNPIENL